MKISVDRLYTHPVLADGRDDYKNCTFDAKLTPSSDAAGNLILGANFSTNCAALKTLIERGVAEYILHVECPLTCYRKIFSSADENFLCRIPRDGVKKNLECLALIVLAEDCELSCDDWNEDFARLSFKLKKGNVLAYRNFQPLPLPDDDKIFRNVSSIFSVYKKLGDSSAPFDVEMTSEKIKLGLNENDYALYRRYRLRPETQAILNALIILPALVYVFDALKEDFDAHDSEAWFLSLRAAYKRKGLSFDELIDSESSLKLAQEVMNLPLAKALENISLICDAAED